MTNEKRYTMEVVNACTRIIDDLNTISKFSEMPFFTDDDEDTETYHVCDSFAYHTNYPFKNKGIETLVSQLNAWALDLYESTKEMK